MTPPLTFSYPRRGLSGDFNTFRLGRAAAEKYAPGSSVELIDSRSKKLITRATVQSVHTGKLTDMARMHSHYAHNWKDSPADMRAELLVASMKRRYPPNRVQDDSVVTVIYLKEDTPTCPPP